MSYVDSNVQVSPQGTAGGGNAFNIAPLFGNVFGTNAASTKDSGATTATSKPTQGMGGQIGEALTSTSVWLVIGGVVCVIGALFLLFRRKKRPA